MKYVSATTELGLLLMLEKSTKPEVQCDWNAIEYTTDSRYEQMNNIKLDIY